MKSSLGGAHEGGEVLYPHTPHDGMTVWACLITNWLQPKPKPFVNAGLFREWAATITKIAKAICESLSSKKAAVAAREDLNRANTCHTIIATSFWDENMRLRQPGRPFHA